MSRIVLIGAVALFIALALVGGARKLWLLYTRPAVENVSRAPAASPPSRVAAQRSAPAAAVPAGRGVAAAGAQSQGAIAASPALPSIDRIYQLFTTGSSKLPIVETVTYASSVPWIKGRPAWIADYATYYQTSRHFIARGLNGKPDYFSQTVSTGSQFNVFRKDKTLHFYLLIDVSSCKMGLYYLDLDTQERVLLKTYTVGLGRPDATKPSGTLTPLGTYLLGQKIAIYKQGMVGTFQNREVEMIRVFGTRWIPFGQEMEGATASAKGYGIHGAPWREEERAQGRLVENRTTIGRYESDGCIRLTLEDMEELFAIVITKPTYVVIAKQWADARLPGTEVAVPSR